MPRPRRRRPLPVQPRRPNGAAAATNAWFSTGSYMGAKPGLTSRAGNAPSKPGCLRPVSSCPASQPPVPPPRITRGWPLSYPARAVAGLASRERRKARSARARPVLWLTDFLPHGGLPGHCHKSSASSNTRGERDVRPELVHRRGTDSRRAVEASVRYRPLRGARLRLSPQPQLLRLAAGPAGAQARRPLVQHHLPVHATQLPVAESG